ncbi:DUF6181 family protein [Streptomyces sp. YPW6]|uniref:DUF6181 family protein n=1 Tax=Streptomyces sp. YPW6 TaxID=2840373 RepID=UPI0010084F7F
MSAYKSRGRGVLVRLRVEHRLSLEELALLLSAAHPDDEPELTQADVRQSIAQLLAMEGSDAVVSASDSIRSADDPDEAAEHLAWARRMVAAAYRRDFAGFPAELTAFEGSAQHPHGGVQ